MNFNTTQSASKTMTGWTVGGGLEYMLTSNWLIRGEYRYADNRSWSAMFFPAGPAAPDVVFADFKTRTHTGLFGVAYKLGGPVVARDRSRCAPMLKAGYDVRLASGAITAGGTLGILIPPSVMLIVYAAVAGQSIVKLYAAAMLPGFFLTFLYLVYILGWAIINPKIAPKLSPDQYRVEVPDWLRASRARPVPQRRPRPPRRPLLRPGLARGAPAATGRSSRTCWR